MDSSSGSSTVTMTAGNSSISNSQQLSSSVSSRSPNARSSSDISKAYKHASQLFLTRRFPEALSILEPVISPAKQPNSRESAGEDPPLEAPIAKATRTQRVKFWVLYITLLNSIVDLGQDEGKRGFGQARHKEMVTRVRNGDIWETVVRDGYAGKEGSVDAEVVYNLATLLLGQASSQAMTQSRLESYLASSPLVDLDIKQHLDQNTSQGARSQDKGAETPKDLTSRLKILELFALHVLPRNEEWDYARSFISMSDTLDDERRETFLQSLEELHGVREFEMREEAAILQKEKDAQVREKLGHKNRREAENNSSSGQNGSLHRRTSSEVDYGIEKDWPNGHAVCASNTGASDPPSKSAPAAAAGGSRFPRPTEASKNGSVRKSSHKRPPAYLQKVRNLFQTMQGLVRNMAISIEANPTMLFKMLLSTLAIIMALSRKDVRERVKRIAGAGWDKIRATVRMGVKVSYI